MYTTYHLDSAQEVNTDILEAIKAAFKNKPITIIVEEQQEEDFEITNEMKGILDERLAEAENTYIPAESVIKNLKQKFDV